MYSPHHIAFSVSDQQKSVDFYKKLGFKELSFWQGESTESELKASAKLFLFGVTPVCVFQKFSFRLGLHPSIIR